LKSNVTFPLIFSPRLSVASPSTSSFGFYYFRRTSREKEARQKTEKSAAGNDGLDSPGHYSLAGQKSGVVSGRWTGYDKVAERSRIQYIVEGPAGRFGQFSGGSELNVAKYLL
jgi:hypothetical protein